MLLSTIQRTNDNLSSACLGPKFMGKPSLGTNLPPNEVIKGSSVASALQKTGNVIFVPLWHSVAQESY